MAHRKPRFVRKYLLYATLTIAVVMASVFVTHHSRIEHLTSTILLQQARALYGELIMTRKWVNKHGGVYVKVGPKATPNPFLASRPGLKVNITDESGDQYTLINPAIAVREISEISQQEGSFELHIASLDPVSPASRKPDDFERNALLAFEQGLQEAFTVEETEKGSFYRYMAPIKFEQRCNKCHAFQKLRQGDIRGGISISIPMQEVQQHMSENRRFSFYSAITVLITLFAILAFISAKFMQKLNKAQEELEISATTDSLTGLFNRKAAYERLSEQLAKTRRLSTHLSCLMIDIDHFKRVNDQHGHLVGDRVLQEVADCIKQSSREYDILCRYGGEEFLIILPETGLSTAITVAERYRQKIAEAVIEIDQQKLRLTISIGVTEAQSDETETRDMVIARADEALYQAKEQGRNQVVVLP